MKLALQSVKIRSNSQSENDMLTVRSDCARRALNVITRTLTRQSISDVATLILRASRGGGSTSKNGEFQWLHP